MTDVNLNDYEDAEDEYFLGGPHGDPDKCPTWYDGCNCSVYNLVGLWKDVCQLHDAIDHVLHHLQADGALDRRMMSKALSAARQWKPK